MHIEVQFDSKVRSELFAVFIFARYVDVGLGDDDLIAVDERRMQPHLTHLRSATSSLGMTENHTHVPAQLKLCIEVNPFHTKA